MQVEFLKISSGQDIVAYLRKPTSSILTSREL